MVSIIVQVLNVVFSSRLHRDFTSQKPESLKWENAVEPPAMAMTMQAKCRGDSSATMGMAATLTDRFRREHGSCICEVLKGRTGCPVVPCDTCIADCVGYVEEELARRA